ncbi:hypothetical protein HMN09_00199000 [Mycena chlorophos]|uniref:Uncharacterized protein n=1 Tax=Mycena chlorophos TaxID=658473 RepID=A0A8H6TQQ7_MYCCL|nr:hypothetical protein HMN09_00199000 [Mycena chlorophos]
MWVLDSLSTSSSSLTRSPQPRRALTRDARRASPDVNDDEQNPPPSRRPSSSRIRHSRPLIGPPLLQCRARTHTPTRSCLVTAKTKIPPALGPSVGTPATTLPGYQSTVNTRLVWGMAVPGSSW